MKSSRKKKITRREFVKTSVGAGLAAATAGCASIPGLRGLASVETNNSYDYIVIGSGAGGGPVVANLVKAGFRVCLLEAGGVYPADPNHIDPAHRNYEVPSFHPFATEDKDMSWSFFVNHYKDPEQQKRDSKYVPGKGILYPRASTLGGCTAHNAMITLYPDNSDWDNIASATGDTTWASDKMRDYFQRLEKMNYGTAFQAATQRHGTNGWLSVEQNDFWVRVRDTDAKMHKILIAAAGGKSLIDPVLLQVALRDPNGWDYVQNKKDGSYLVPKATAGGRRNGPRELILTTKDRYPDRLDIRTNALASRIVLDDNRRAIAVEYREGAKLYRAVPGAEGSTIQGVARKVELKRDGSGQVRGEIILAGGAFNSPQLLLLSGIGTSQQGINALVDVPGVGKNLQDRYEIGVVTKLKTGFAALAGCTFGQDGDPCLQAYDLDPVDQIYSSNGPIVSNIMRSDSSKKDPDLIIFALPGKFRGYFPGWSKECLQPNSKYMTWAILKGHTFNTAGTVTLRSADPLDTPEINFNYFDAGGEEDLKSVLKGIDVARSINKNHLLQQFIDHEELPHKQGQDLKSFVKNEVWGHHASCTNKMGRFDTDPDAVVDSKFRVRGTAGLRIVDASVFPRVPGLFIVLPIYMIAEKASDDIISDARKT